MKICYFSCSSNFGGMEKIIIDTLNEISKENECSIVIPKNCSYINRFSKDVQIISFKSVNKRYNPFLYLEVLNEIKDYDIVHTHGAKATQIAYILNKINPFIHIATKHNIRKGKIFNRVKNVISVSSEVAKTISHLSNVIYFGIKKEKKIEVKKNEIFTILAVGRLDAIKGFDRLIEVVSKLQFDFKLNIIGEGSQKEKLEKLIVSNNLQNKVTLLGFKNNIPEYLANSQLQVISSLSEGLPLTLLEGIMNSSVIISTPVGGIVEVLNKHYLVSIEDFSTKITEIYKNYESICDDFKSKHEHLKKKFDFDSYSKNLIKYYKGCIDAKTL
uniref:glycosyltransferase n=1 Tax=Aliarcobacter sp. TaxID=2321116 RepID=UPI004047AFD3